ncbi:MAG: hypothetical protein KJO38_02400, partial [Gammaproteobacteria bacterium]|nr:hypothetical protein [Gammaproteobacteria bacterium]
MTVAMDLSARLRGWVRRKTGLPYYCWRRPELRNFGDELNGFLLERLSRRAPYRIGRAETFEHLFAIGSILQ